MYSNATVAFMMNDHWDKIFIYLKHNKTAKLLKYGRFQNYKQMILITCMNECVFHSTMWFPNLECPRFI